MENIRRLDLCDPSVAEEIWALQHAAYRLEAALIGVAELPPLQDTVQSLRQREEEYYGYYEADGELAGSVSVLRTGREMTICRMMVAPDRLRRGIASALLADLLHRRYPGCAWTVHAAARNIPAIRLYERSGFRISDTWQPFPGLAMVRLTRPEAAEKL